MVRREVPDPAVNYHLTQIVSAMAQQERVLTAIAKSNARIADALERIATQYAGPPPSIDQEVEQS